MIYCDSMGASSHRKIIQFLSFGFYKKAKTSFLKFLGCEKFRVNIR